MDTIELSSPAVVPPERAEISPVRPLPFAAALIGGVAVGIIAQLLRQHVGALGELGGATAPWITPGFLLAVVTVQGRWFVDRAINGGILSATYLFAWLLAYHTTFALQQSVPLSSAWNQARPWMVAVAPASIVLGLLLGVVGFEDWRGDVALAMPIAWSFPEALRAIQHGWPYFLVEGLPIALIAVAPLALSRRRPILVRSRLVALPVTALVAIVAYFVYPHIPNH